MSTNNNDLIVLNYAVFERKLFKDIYLYTLPGVDTPNDPHVHLHDRK